MLMVTVPVPKRLGAGINNSRVLSLNRYWIAKFCSRHLRRISVALVAVVNEGIAVCAAAVIIVPEQRRGADRKVFLKRAIITNIVRFVLSRSRHECCS